MPLQTSQKVEISQRDGLFKKNNDASQLEHIASSIKGCPENVEDVCSLLTAGYLGKDTWIKVHESHPSKIPDWFFKAVNCRYYEYTGMNIVGEICKPLHLGGNSILPPHQPATGASYDANGKNGTGLNKSTSLCEKVLNICVTFFLFITVWYLFQCSTGACPKFIDSGSNVYELFSRNINLTFRGMEAWASKQTSENMGNVKVSMDLGVVDDLKHTENTVPVFEDSANESGQNKAESDKSNPVAELKLVESHIAGNMTELKRVESEKAAAVAELARVESEKAAAVAELARVESEKAAAVAELARVESEKAAAAKAELARVESEKAAAAKAELARVESEKAAATEAELARVESEKAAAAKAELARVESEKAAATEAELKRVESEKAAAAVAELARVESEKAAAAVAELKRVESEKAAAAEADAHSIISEPDATESESSSSEASSAGLDPARTAPMDLVPSAQTLTNHVEVVLNPGDSAQSKWYNASIESDKDLKTICRSPNRSHVRDGCRFHRCPCEKNRIELCRDKRYGECMKPIIGEKSERWCNESSLGAQDTCKSIRCSCERTRYDKENICFNLIPGECRDWITGAPRSRR
jgi:hypothetical protein